MLILAGVSIATLTGPNGLLTRANEAKEETKMAGEEELRKLTQGEAATHLEDYEYIDENGERITIPAKCAVSQVEGENTIADGLVIIDKNGNEFVWVPVNNFNEFRREHFGTEEQKYFWKDFVTDIPSIDNMYEPTPDNISGTTDITAEEVTNMYKSVEVNGGFYIGRYEAGIDSNITRNENSNIEDKLVIQKNKYPYNYIIWGDSIEDESGGAIEVSRKMYPGHSTLCYGVQWDAVLRWINNDSSLSKYLTDSTGIGNYSGNRNKTGINEDYKLKNIYDMAGNVREWTMEIRATNTTNVFYQGVCRGGRCDGAGNEDPISYRHASKINEKWANIGFRVAYYL